LGEGSCDTCCPYGLHRNPAISEIWLKDEPAFGIAGLWRDWPDGAYSFTMLTVNAEHHPVMNRMHAPGMEKRGIVIVPRGPWDDWLTCREPEVARSFFDVAAGGRNGSRA